MELFIRLDSFLARDFHHIGEPLLARCAELDGQRLYLTGATGFFGKSLLALLALLYQRGVRFEVTALSRDPQAFLAAQPWCRVPWLRLCQGDVRNPWPADGHYNLLLHAATDTATRAQRDKLALFNGVLSGTQNALDFCAAHGVPRLLLTGSGAQFGALPAEYALTGVPDDSLLGCDPTQPGSAYGEAKRVAEWLASLHAQRHGTAVIYTRCFAFVGPGLDLEGHFAIGNFIRDAMAKRPITLQSAGLALRSYLYSADLAVWLLLLLLEAPAGTRVNVGADRAVSVKDLADKVREVLRPELPVQLGPAGPAESRQIYLPAIDVARRLGLNVWTPLESAILRTAEWHGWRSA